MNLSRIFIERPVMTALLSLAILLFGIVAFQALPVAALPAVDYPTLQVSANLRGASPETMAATVATVLEREFSTIPGIESMSSTNGQSNSTITIQFALDRDIDAAAQDVQAAISKSAGRLPLEMLRPPWFQKVNPAERPILYLAIGSPTLPLSAVHEYADTLLAQRISMISGVSQVQVMGSQKYAVRVQIDPDQLLARNIGVDEVQRAISSSNTNIPSGRLDGQSQAFTIQSSGGLSEAKAYRPIIVAYRSGTPVRLEEIATVSDSVENNKVAAWFNGKRCLLLSVQRQAGSNTVQVVDDIRALLPQIISSLPPAVQLETAFDASDSIRGSIRDVEFTLILTIGLVILVIFLFLKNLTATLIPALAVPFSIVGTFAVMYLLGYSLNNLSLMALTLSVGFVVDDAIVMLENIVRHMEMGKGRMEAALAASREIGFTILSMTVSLVAVFIPVLFMRGLVGRLLHEFSVTIVVAILISGFVSLSLTPMLASRFLKVSRTRPQNWFSRGFERSFAMLTHGYDKTLRLAIRYRFATLAVSSIMLIGTVALFRTMPTGFIPNQDSSSFSGATRGPQDASFAFMEKHHFAVGEAIRSHPDVAGVGAFLPPGNSGFLFARTKPLNDRRLTVDQIINQLRPKTAAVPGLMTFLQNPPPITVGGQQGASAYQLVLQSTNLHEIYDWAPKLMARMRTLRGFVDVSSDMQVASPQIMVDINRDRALALGISPQQIQNALFTAYSSREVSTIYSPANQYPVIMEVEPKFQETPDSLSKLHVRSASGGLVPLESVVDIRNIVGPLNVSHFGQLPAVNLSFNLQPGFSLGEAAREVDAAVRNLRMPASITTTFQGTVKEFQRSFRDLTVLLLVAVLVIYIVLGILYESFRHPLTILSGLPSAVLGALATLWIFDKDIDLYAFVGLIMLLGVVKKNAIMMVDFAIQARAQGRNAHDAIVDGCLLRFRPIMMTTVAALFGTLPIALAYGEGADARQPLGLAVVGGLLISQVLTLYITPVIYPYLESAPAASPVYARLRTPATTTLGS